MVVERIRPGERSPAVVCQPTLTEREVVSQLTNAGEALNRHRWMVYHERMRNGDKDEYSATQAQACATQRRDQCDARPRQRLSFRTPAKTLDNAQPGCNRELTALKSGATEIIRSHSHV